MPRVEVVKGRACPRLQMPTAPGHPGPQHVLGGQGHLQIRTLGDLLINKGRSHPDGLFSAGQEPTGRETSLAQNAAAATSPGRTSARSPHLEAGPPWARGALPCGAQQNAHGCGGPSCPAPSRPSVACLKVPRVTDRLAEAEPRTCTGRGSPSQALRSGPRFRTVRARSQSTPRHTARSGGARAAPGPRTSFLATWGKYGNWTHSCHRAVPRGKTTYSPLSPVQGGQGLAFHPPPARVERGLRKAAAASTAWSPCPRQPTASHSRK